MHTIKEMAEYLIYLSERDKTEDKEEAVRKTAEIIGGVRVNNGTNRN